MMLNVCEMATNSKNINMKYEMIFLRTRFWNWESLEVQGQNHAWGEHWPARWTYWPSMTGCPFLTPYTWDRPQNNPCDPLQWATQAASCTTWCVHPFVPQKCTLFPCWQCVELSDWVPQTNYSKIESPVMITLPQFMKRLV